MYPYIHNTTGKEESPHDCLKSLMATYLFRYKTKRLNHEYNVDFNNYLYQPEACTTSNEFMHEKEDHRHVLKRITERLHSGTIPEIDLCCFRDALSDPSTGLTYEALTRKQKQSVPHCEQIFSKGVLDFLRSKGHTSEARFVEVVRNWHKAADGRGISEELRSKYNTDMLNFLLEDWMPLNYCNTSSEGDIKERKRRDGPSKSILIKCINYHHFLLYNPQRCLKK